jgi:hypothetical protein
MITEKSRASQVRRVADTWLNWSNLGIAVLLILTISLAMSILLEGQS